MASVKTSRAVNELFDTFLGVPAIASMAGSALWTGIVVVIIIALIAAFVYRDSDGLLSKTLRVIFWGLLFSSAVLFLRDRKMRSDIASSHENADTRELFDGISSRDYAVQQPLMTRAGTDSSQSSRPLVSDSELAAVAARRGFALVPAVASVPAVSSATPAPPVPPRPDMLV